MSRRTLRFARGLVQQNRLPPAIAVPPLQTPAFAAHERSQLAANNRDFFQRLPPKFDLGLEHTDVSQRDGRDDKVINVILQTTQGGFYPEHFRSPYATETPPKTPSIFKYNAIFKYYANEKSNLLFRINLS